MDAAPGLVVDTVTKRFGGVTALNRLSLEVAPERVTSVIGSNGAGKTTLLNVISQLTPADEGRVLLGPLDLTGLSPHRVVHHGIARTFQQLRIFQKLSVLDNVLLAFQQTRGESLLQLFARPGAVVANRRSNRTRAHALLEAIGLADLAGTPAGELSYGQQKLVSLARVIATDAGVLMLDEPTSGLPPELTSAILAMVRKLVAEGRTVLLIEHDMDVVFEVSDWIVVLDEGRLLFQGTPEAVRRNAEVRALYFGKRVA
jgi:ABC-type branched-subunit amino acid transport system ATPase component